MLLLLLLTGVKYDAGTGVEFVSRELLEPAAGAMEPVSNDCMITNTDKIILSNQLFSNLRNFFLIAASFNINHVGPFSPYHMGQPSYNKTLHVETKL